MLKKLVIVLSITLIMVFGFQILTVGAEKNLIVNPGFEEMTGDFPDGWTREAYKNTPSDVAFEVVEGQGHSGNRCVGITNKTMNNTLVFQTVPMELGKTYKLTAWIKIANIESPNTIVGANISVINGIYESNMVRDTKGQWEKIENYFRVRDSGDPNMKVGLRMGGFGVDLKGTAYFDDISIVKVEKPEAGVKVTDFFVRGQKPKVDNNGSTGSNNIILYLLLGILIIAAMIAIELRLAKKNKSNQ